MLRSLTSCLVYCSRPLLVDEVVVTEDVVLLRYMEDGKTERLGRLKLDGDSEPPHEEWAEVEQRVRREFAEAQGKADAKAKAKAQRGRKRRHDDESEGDEGDEADELAEGGESGEEGDVDGEDAGGDESDEGDDDNDGRDGGGNELDDDLDEEADYDEQVLLEGDISALSAKVGAVEGSEDEAEEGEEEGAEEENNETTADGDEGRSGEGSSATAGLRDACTRERTVDGGECFKQLIYSSYGVGAASRMWYCVLPVRQIDCRISIVPPFFPNADEEKRWLQAKEASSKAIRKRDGYFFHNPDITIH